MGKVGEWLCKHGFHKMTWWDSGYRTEGWWEPLYDGKCERCGLVGRKVGDRP
jgi:hypothetical protein